VSSTAAPGGAVRVKVWAVAVVGTRRLGQLVAAWSTESLLVQRADGRWVLAGYASLPGPVPAATQPPTDIASALRTLAAMRDLDDGA